MKNKEIWTDADYIEQHLNNVIAYIELIKNRFLQNNDFYIKDNMLIYMSLMDTFFINVYWLAEKKNIKNIKNTNNKNNPFYIWCKFFDTLKHPNRQIEIADRIFPIIKRNTRACQNNGIVMDNLDEFIKNIKLPDEENNISNNDYFDLYIRYIQPMYIETNSWEVYGYKETYQISIKTTIIFWHSIKNFFIYLKAHINDDWKNIWDMFEKENDISSLKSVWNMYYDLFRISFNASSRSK